MRPTFRRSYLSHSLVILGIALGASTGETAAGQTGYDCSILSVQQLNSPGQLEANGNQAFYLGTSFSVDRNSGRIINGPLDNGLFKRVEVIDRGSKEQAFELLSVTGGYVHALLVRIEEYEATRKKPFSALYDDYVYTGNCE